MYYYSKKTNTFYPELMMEDYIEAGTLPLDLVEVSDAIYFEFTQPKPEKMRFGNSEGLPIWIDLPSPTQDEFMLIAERQKQALFSDAAESITPLQDAVDLGIATDKELMQLNAWKQYRVDLNRIDTSNAPDIAWPEKPQ